MPAFLQNLYFMANRRYQQRAFKPYVIHRVISGVPFDFYIADPVAKDWYDTGAEDWREMDYVRDHFLAPGDVVLECGAHHGVTTSWLATCVGPKGKVVAFEPSPFNCGVIKKNLELNHLTNVEVVNKGVGDKVGTGRFSFVSNASIQRGKVGTFEIGITTPDEYLSYSPTVLKVDVEGYDVEVLKGAKKLLATKPKLAIEIHTDQLPGLGHTYKDVFKLLDLKDYDCMMMKPEAFVPLNKVDLDNITTNVHLYAVPKARAKQPAAKKRR